MKLGNFFTAAANSRPVNPRPFTITAVSRSNVLPGGEKNPTKRQVAARVTGCFVFAGGDVLEEARGAARKYLLEYYEQNKLPLPVPENDYNIEYTYQLLWRIAYEWNESDKSVGADRLFDNVNLLREIVVFKEADRALAQYFKFVDDEHPEAVDQATFRDAQG